MFKFKKEVIKDQDEISTQIKKEREQEELKMKLSWERKIENEKAKLIEEIDDELVRTSVICIETDYTEIKQFALNYMIEKGWICVQNDTPINKYGMCYVLTFAKQEVANKFLVK